MKSLFFTIFILAFFQLSCRKDPKIEPVLPPDPCVSIGYSLYSTADFDYEKKHLSTPVPFGPFNFNANTNGTTYGSPVVNPNNPYEIIYVYRDTNITGIESEVWKFNFCTGEKRKITDNYYYRLDWGSNGWLLYTGTDHEIFKIKDNGDSLTQLTNLPGYNHAGKWSPDGSKFYFTGDNGLRVCNQNGVMLSVYASLNYYAIDWIDDENLLCPYFATTYNFHSFNYITGEIKVVNSNWACSSCAYIYNREQNVVFGTLLLGTGQEDYFLKYDLNNNTVDTISVLYDTYYYKTGSYVKTNNKIVTTLIRKNWKDSTQNQVYVRAHLLIMNPDGTDERIIEMPE